MSDIVAECCHYTLMVQVFFCYIFFTYERILFLVEHMSRSDSFKTKCAVVVETLDKLARANQGSF